MRALCHNSPRSFAATGNRIELQHPKPKPNPKNRWGEPVLDFISAVEHHESAVHAEARGLGGNALYWVCAYGASLHG